MKTETIYDFNFSIGSFAIFTGDDEDSLPLEVIGYIKIHHDDYYFVKGPKEILNKYEITKNLFVENPNWAIGMVLADELIPAPSRFMIIK